MDRPTLVACPRCSRHHFTSEKRCPFCAEPASMKLAKAAMAVATPMVLAACYGTGKWCDSGDNCGLDDSAADSGGTTGATTETTGGTEPPSVSVTWDTDSVKVSVSGAAAGLWFGMAETADCDDCWTGEDCVYGYETESGTLSYCHDAGDSGTTLTYGGDANALGAGETVFVDATADGKVTYILESDPDFGGDGSCYVWGHDASYYEGLGCTEL